MTEFLPIFKAGTHTDASGKDKTWTTGELDQIVNNYNQKGDDWKEAPLVIGHPKHDAPAYGWIAELKRHGIYLMAKFKDVSPELVKAIREGKYRYVSASFRPNLTLRHVGVLGGATPAVAGLAILTNYFSEDKEIMEYQVDFAEIKEVIKEFDQKSVAPPVDQTEGTQNIDDLPGNSPDEMENNNMSEEKESKEKKAPPGTGTESVETKTDTGTGTGTGNEKPVTGTDGGDGSDYSEMMAEIAALRNEVNQMKADKVNSTASDFVEKLAEKGVVLPKDRNGMIAFVKHLQGLGNMNFAEGDNEVEKSPIEFFSDFCEGLTPRIPLNRLARGSRSSTTNTDEVYEFAESKNLNVDDDEVEIAERAKKLATEKNISFSDALEIVEKENGGEK